MTGHAVSRAPDGTYHVAKVQAIFAVANTYLFSAGRSANQRGAAKGDVAQCWPRKRHVRSENTE